MTSSDPLIAGLRALGDEQRRTPVPDLLGPALGRIATQPRRGRRARARPLRPALVLPALLALALAVTAAVEPARSAVLDLLGLAGGEEVVRVPATPAAPAPGATGAGARSGRPLTLRAARDAVAFPVRIPSLLGAPDEVRLDRGLAGGAVTLVYSDRTALTALAGDTQVYARKTIGPATRVQDATVDGRAALFLSGAPSRWIALDRAGRVIERTAVLVDANVLLFDSGGVAYRLETRAGLARALAIARSLR